jgi:hypothetical protein
MGQLIEKTLVEFLAIENFIKCMIFSTKIFSPPPLSHFRIKRTSGSSLKKKRKKRLKIIKNN